MLRLSHLASGTTARRSTRIRDAEVAVAEATTMINAELRRLCGAPAVAHRRADGLFRLGHPMIEHHHDRR